MTNLPCTRETEAFQRTSVSPESVAGSGLFVGQPHCSEGQYQRDDVSGPKEEDYKRLQTMVILVFVEH